MLHREHSNLSVELTDWPVRPVIMSARGRGINRVSSNDKVRPVRAWPIRCWGGLQGRMGEVWRQKERGGEGVGGQIRPGSGLPPVLSFCPSSRRCFCCFHGVVLCTDETILTGARWRVEGGGCGPPQHNQVHPPEQVFSHKSVPQWRPSRQLSG